MSDDLAARKARGAFFTPSDVASFIANWSIRSAADRVLEPSCGDAEFLAAAVAELKAIEGTESHAVSVQVFGVEIHAPSAALATARVKALGADASIKVGDFFDLKADPSYDVVIGNPPFIRFHEFRGAARARAISASADAGVAVSGLASSWASFVVHATQFLKAGGRLGMVLPAELLTVDYASTIRQHLLDSFGEIRVVTFNQPVFPGVQTDVVLLLADGYGSSTMEVAVGSPVAIDGLVGLGGFRSWTPTSRGEKWSLARLTSAEEHLSNRAQQREEFGVLGDWGTVSIGVVTGNNKFFTFGTEVKVEKQIRDVDVVRLAPPMKPAKRGLAYTVEDWVAADDKQSATWLFKPREPLDRHAKLYIEAGELHEQHTGYKCTHRFPWWDVPLGTAGDLMVTYMSSEMVRIFSNREHYFQLNSLHRFELEASLKDLGLELLSLAGLNSVTLVGSELLGRAYGGGVLKLELHEVRSLPMPTASFLRRCRADLLELADEIDRLLRAGNAVTASAMVDEIILRKHLGFSSEEVQTLQATHVGLRFDRLTRARSVQFDTN